MNIIDIVQKVKVLPLLSVLIMGILPIFMFFGCEDHMPTEETSKDTCAIDHIQIFPQEAMVSVGEMVDFNACAYDAQNRRIEGGPQFTYEASTRSVRINKYTGEASPVRPAGTAYITATTHDCDGNTYSKTAVIYTYSPGN